MLILPERAVTRPLLKNRGNEFLFDFVDAQRSDVRIHIVSWELLESARLIRRFVLSFLGNNISFSEFSRFDILVCLCTCFSCKST